MGEQMKKNNILITFVIYTLFMFSNLIAKADTTRWPVPDWETSENLPQMDSKQCQSFKQYSVESKNIKTDGLLIIKNGLIQYENYSSAYDMNKPHALWSISKTITGALLGIADRDGRINLNQKLFNFYPKENMDKNYKKISINNLLYLDTGFIWDEESLDVSVNPVVAMLYGEGHKNMTNYAIKMQIIKEGPAFKWNYSTGTPTITMGVLHQIYGDQLYEDMPWRNLFNPLGIKTAVFERDLSGTYIGGAGVFATPRDIAKVGYLYLNQGKWNGEVIIPPDWIKKMLTPSPGYVSPGTVVTNISETGVYGGSIWLNRKAKEGFGKPYPNSPEDMFLAVGFMGQYLIMLPTQKMIIVRTGHDFQFNNKVDDFVSHAIACFHDPKYTIPNEKPRKKLPVNKIGDIIRGVKNAIEANTLQGSIAKSICSCHLVSEIDIPTCLKHNDLTLSKIFTKI